MGEIALGHSDTLMCMCPGAFEEGTNRKVSHQKGVGIVNLMYTNVLSALSVTQARWSEYVRVRRSSEYQG